MRAGVLFRRSALGLGLAPWHYVLVLVVTSFGALIPACPVQSAPSTASRCWGCLWWRWQQWAALAFAAVTHALDWVLASGTGMYFVLRERLWLALPGTGRVSFRMSRRGTDVTSELPLPACCPGVTRHLNRTYGTNGTYGLISPISPIGPIGA